MLETSSLNSQNENMTAKRRNMFEEGAAEKKLCFKMILLNILKIEML